MPKTTALSTHATRNGTRPVKATRKRGGKSSAGDATSALAATRRAQARAALEDDVEEHYLAFQAKVTEMALKHDRKEVFIKKLLNNGTQYKQRRGLSIRNAIMHDLSRKAKDEGEDSDLASIREGLSQEEYMRIKEEMSTEERERIMKQLAEHRGVQHRGIRATNKAVAMDAMQTAARVGEVLVDLFERTGVRAFTMFTRGTPEDPAVPHIVDSDDARGFFQQVYGKSFLDFLRKFEQWSCTQDTEVKEKNDVGSVRKQIAALILEGLRKIKNNKKVDMDYVNYEVEIQHKLGVELAGWPEKITFARPVKLSAKEAREIRDDLRSGAIRWVGLTKTQREELAQELKNGGSLKKRKERNDKGKKRGPREASDDADSDDSEGEKEDQVDEEEEDDDDEEEPTPPKRRVTTGSHTPAPKGARAPNASNASAAHGTQVAQVTNARAQPASQDAPNAHASHVANMQVANARAQPTPQVSHAPNAPTQPTPQAFDAANLGSFDFSGMDFGPLDLLHDFTHTPAQHEFGINGSGGFTNAYGMPPLPNSYVWDGAFAGADGGRGGYGAFACADGGRSSYGAFAGADGRSGGYGMPPLSSSHLHFGGAQFGDANSSSYELPPLSGSHVGGNAQFTDPNPNPNGAAGSYGVFSVGLNDATNTDQGTQKKRKRSAEDAGEAEAVKKPRKPRAKASTDDAAAAGVAPKRKSKKKSVAEGALEAEA
ncbi:hypothetical protein DFH09DRAFT_1092676 [Mycena vulgaris]|nr:hypothetical protein DFH09DRAFT_1092676 [Mycena vulgaris]